MNEFAHFLNNYSWTWALVRLYRCRVPVDLVVLIVPEVTESSPREWSAELFFFAIQSAELE